HTLRHWLDARARLAQHGPRDAEVVDVEHPHAYVRRDVEASEVTEAVVDVELDDTVDAEALVNARALARRQAIKRHAANVELVSPIVRWKHVLMLREPLARDDLEARRAQREIDDVRHVAVVLRA